MNEQSVALSVAHRAHVYRPLSRTHSHAQTTPPVGRVTVETGEPNKGDLFKYYPVRKHRLSNRTSRRYIIYCFGQTTEGRSDLFNFR